MMNTEAPVLVPAPLFADTDEALPLAEALLRAFWAGDGSDVVSPALCDDDAEFLRDALSLVGRPVRSLMDFSPGGVRGVCLVVEFG